MWGPSERAAPIILVRRIFGTTLARALSFLVESESRSSFLFEHDLFRKPVPTFRDHALVALAVPGRLAAAGEFSARDELRASGWTGLHRAHPLAVGAEDHVEAAALVGHADRDIAGCRHRRAVDHIDVLALRLADHQVALRVAVLECAMDDVVIHWTDRLRAVEREVSDQALLLQHVSCGLRLRRRGGESECRGRQS